MWYGIMRSTFCTKQSWQHLSVNITSGVAVIFLFGKMLSFPTPHLPLEVGPFNAAMSEWVSTSLVGLIPTVTQWK